MRFLDFQKYMKYNKLWILTFKEDNGVSLGFGFRDFVFELKKIPRDQSFV